MPNPAPYRMAAVRAILILAVLFVSPAVVHAQTSIYQFDPSNNLLGTITAPGAVTAMTYDSLTDNLVVDSDSAGIYTRYYYDAAGDITQTFTEPRPVTSMAYDAALNEIFTGGGDTLDEYDSSNNLVGSITTPDPITEIIYESEGTQVSVITTNTADESMLRQVGNTESGKDFVLQGGVTSATDDGVQVFILVASEDLGQTTMTVYDSTGQPLESVDTLGIVTAMTYDPVSRVFGIGQTNTNTGQSSWLDADSVDTNTRGQDILIPLTPFNPGRPLPSPPTSSTWDSENNSFYVAVSPESSSLALIAPALLLFAGLAFLRAKRRI
jgi:YD repeat-containing protein